MDHDVMHRQVRQLMKWKEEVTPLLDFVKEHMPSAEQLEEYRARKAAEEQEAADEAAALTAAHHVDGQDAGTETKVEDGADDKAETEPKGETEPEKEPEGALDVTKVQTAHIDGKVTITPVDKGANDGAGEAAGASGEKTGTEVPAEAKKAPAGLPPTSSDEPAF